MKLLAFDTSTDACSMALQIDDERLVDHRVVSQQHAQILLPALDALLSDAGITAAALDGVIYGRGPGSFTGVRIAAATAQGLAMAADIGVIGVSSLAAMARVVLDDLVSEEQSDNSPLHTAVDRGALPVFATLDARMGEIYAAMYRATFLDGAVWQLQNIGDEAVLPPKGSLAQLWPGGHSLCLVIGSGLAVYPDLLLAPPAEDVAMIPHADGLPHAGGLLDLALPRALTGQWQNAGDAIPTYLRDKVALTQREQQAQRNTRP